MKVYILSLLLVGSLASSAICAQENEKSMEVIGEDDLGNVSDAFQENFFEALKQKAIENYEKAIVALKRCEQLEPDNAVVHFELGRNYAFLENYEAAISSLQKANRLKPGQQWILVDLMEAYYANKNMEEAIIITKKLVDIDEQYYKNLADLYFKTEKYEELLALLDRLDAELGASAFRLELRQRIYALTNNTPAQIQVLKDAIKTNPGIESNYLNLIYVYSEHKMEKEAFEAAEEMKTTFPGSTIVHLALYEFYLDSQEIDKALGSIKIVLKAEEIDAGSKFKVLNDFLLFVKENEQYKEDLKEVLSLFSDTESSSKVYQRLGEYFLLEGNKTQALEYFELGIEKDLENFQLVRNTVLLELESGRFSEAAKISERALELFPAQPVLYLVRGAALNEQGKFIEAAEILIIGMDYVLEEEMSVDFYKQLAVALSGTGNKQKAEEYTKKAEEITNKLN